MCKIVNAIDYPAGIKAAIAYIHKKWGRANNPNYYSDAIKHSTHHASELPRFYLMVDDPNNFCEKFGWTQMDEGNSPDGQVSKIYRIAVSLN